VRTPTTVIEFGEFVGLPIGRETYELRAGIFQYHGGKARVGWSPCRLEIVISNNCHRVWRICWTSYRKGNLRAVIEFGEFVGLPIGRETYELAE